MKNQEVIDLLSSIYLASLKELFNFYSKLEDPELDQEALSLGVTIQQKNFTKFVNQFKIVPDIISLENACYIFTSLMKGKPTIGKDIPKGISFDDFLESIVKISVVGKLKLGVPNNEPDIPGEEKKEEPPYKIFDVKGMHSGIVEKLLKHIGLTPGEKKGPITQFLKKLKLENQKLISGSVPNNITEPDPKPAEEPPKEEPPKEEPQPAENNSQ